ncbi:vitamin K epoxide reductase complex subunit 1 [Ceratina calcarata]|uniref:vitamin-K-epoxide reductase (warfarin-sensitive) n=1 Tax=Ceratina calcarata TaxID=156304 RepID=A0AAJ7ITV1_9HYME|nr:vitamin K epoxide reductase complex subunit 1 [Ceratina calcarata]
MANTIKQSIRKLIAGILTTCIVGFTLSCYAYWVELAKEEDYSYEPMCDISEHISCTKAFQSEYGKGFGLIPETSVFYMPNPIYGLLFYALVAILSVSNKWSALVVALATISNIGTIYLARILYLERNICIVCVSLYVVNVVLLILAIKKHRRLSEDGTKKRKLK